MTNSGRGRPRRGPTRPKKNTDKGTDCLVEIVRKHDTANWNRNHPKKNTKRRGRAGIFKWKGGSGSGFTTEKAKKKG